MPRTTRTARAAARPAPGARPARPLAGQRSRARLDRPTSAPEQDGSPRIHAEERAGVPATPEAPAEARRRPMGSDLLLVVAVLLVLALAATAGLLTVRARGADRLEAARSAALAAAESAAVTVLSYDHRRLDRDFAEAKRLLTGPFAGDYAATSEKVVRPTAEQVRAVVTAEVAASSVVRAPSPDRVVVLLFVDQTTTSTRLDGPKVDLNRVRMTMQRVGEEWKVAAIDAL